MPGVYNIGEMNQRLKIQTWTSAKDAVSNQQVKTWADLKTIWVKELSRKSKERFEARQQVAMEEVEFLAHHNTAFGLLTADNSNITADNISITADNYLGLVKIIDETMRCVLRGEMYYINGVQASGEKGFVILTAEKRDNE
jgi:SPP1 family predicted phage head-tail adaptor